MLDGSLGVTLFDGVETPVVVQQRHILTGTNKQQKTKKQRTGGVHRCRLLDTPGWFKDYSLPELLAAGTFSLLGGSFNLTRFVAA